VEERFDDWPRDAKPILVGVRRESLPSTLLNDLPEPGTQRAIRSEALEKTDDAQRLILKVKDLEALMVEAIDGILESPVIRELIEERLQLGSARPQIQQEGFFGGTLFHAANYRVKPCGTSCRSG